MNVLKPRLCPICGKSDSSRLILSKEETLAALELQKRSDWALCKEHQKLFDEGFIALVEAEPRLMVDGIVKETDARRTGKICHVRRSVAENLFGEAIDPRWPMVFCPPNVLESLQAMVRKSVS